MFTFLRRTPLRVKLVASVLALVAFAHHRTIEKLEARVALDRLQTALPGVLSDT